MKLKLLTWNTRGLDKPDVISLSKLLMESGADIVLLQEIVRYSDYNQFELLEEQLSSVYSYSLDSIIRDEVHNEIKLKEGLVIFSKFKISDSKTLFFTPLTDDKHKRIYQQVALEIENNPFIIINLHLSNNDSFSSAQLSELNQTMDKNVGVIAGDFNLFDLSLLTSLLPDYDSSETFHHYASNKDKALDLFMANKLSVSFLGIKTIENELSDHKAVLTEISFKK